MRENFNIPKFYFDLYSPKWIGSWSDLLSSMSYIMTPPPPPPSGDIVQNLNVGDRLLDNVQFPSYAGETLFILFSFLEYTILSV